jgi:integrase/recombinase XerC
MEQKLAESTLRNYQGAIRMFCDYITSPYYRWSEECEARFGTHPVQICHEWNTVAHLVDYEGGPGRRPLTREECQALFDYADEQVDRAVRLKRKGALTAYRDATVLKVIYAWGLRCNEASKLDRTDWYRNPNAPELGRYGQLNVRWGKRSKGSPPKRRMVASVMPWAVEAVEDYFTNARPRFGLADHPAMWVTERGGRLRPREIEERFAGYRDALGMDADLVRIVYGTVMSRT